MLPPDGESDRSLIAKDLKLVGYRRGKFVFCYVVRNSSIWSQFSKAAAREFLLGPCLQGRAFSLMQLLHT